MWRDGRSENLLGVVEGRVGLGGWKAGGGGGGGGSSYYYYYKIHKTRYCRLHHITTCFLIISFIFSLAAPFAFVRPLLL